jgi:hypothetical protein
MHFHLEKVSDRDIGNRCKKVESYQEHLHLQRELELYHPHPLLLGTITQVPRTRLPSIDVSSKNIYVEKLLICRKEVTGRCQEGEF